jgi:hypothetical protein
MKNVFTLLFVLICSISATSQTKATAFPDAGFMAAFPTKPQVEKNQVDSKVGKIETTSYNCEGEDFLIVVSENIYPIELVKKLDATGISGILDGAKNGAIKNIEAQMGGKFAFTLDENFLFENKYTATKFAGTVEEVDMETVCIMKENHFFVVMLVGNTKSEIATEFVKSFKLIEK